MQLTLTMDVGRPLLLRPFLPQVAFAFGKNSFELLTQRGANVEFQTYLGMGHSVGCGNGDLEEVEVVLKKVKTV